MASIGSFFKNFTSLVLLLIHLGCFTLTIKNHHGSTIPKKKNPKKVTPTPFPPPTSPPSLPQKPHILAPFSSFLKRLVPRNLVKSPKHTTPPVPVSARSSRLSSMTPFATPQNLASDSPLNRNRRRTGVVLNREFDTSPDSLFLFPLRNDMFPCTACGEIFQNPQLLDEHQSIKHAVSELRHGDSGRNVVQIIFRTAWSERAGGKYPKIHRILKIQNRPKILARFEEYRESVKLRAARNCCVRRRDERCLADGNELLRFHCSTFVCNLGEDGGSSACTHAYCCACGIIRVGFSPKMDGIPTQSSSWGAHVAIPEDIEAEFAFMNVKRAMLVCRVVAGRVGREPVEEEQDKDDGGGFDSVVVAASGGRGHHPHRIDDEELVVFNPRAVLPCFVIVYSV